MENENKFKVSIRSMFDYELPDITVKFEDCKTEYTFTGTYESNLFLKTRAKHNL